MNKETYKLIADNKKLPKGTKIATTMGGVSTGGFHELSDETLKSANRVPNHLSDYVPFWILGWKDLHDDLLLCNVQTNDNALNSETSSPLLAEQEEKE